MTMNNIKLALENDSKSESDEEAAYIANAKEIAPDLFKIIDKALALMDGDDYS